jgi:hypothetical protein
MASMGLFSTGTPAPAGHPAPAVSVVMPSMNQVAFLGEAVRSVLAAPGPETELVVMDGGSDDGSQALLASLAAEFPGRLSWASGPDGGPAEAVNEAVRRTRAPLIGWLNSDDLYAPGAIARAFDHLTAHADQVMAYGHGEHVDGEGAFIERYPTLPPSTPLGAWADGCHICQPTAFFRRAAFDALGGLDTGLRASFDYDLWLRLFKAYPRSVGFIDAVQARSRLHAGSITLRFRERVAFEGMQVISRHLGPAPAHWLLTHVDELCAMHPFLPGGQSLRERCEGLVARAQAYVDAHGLDLLRSRVAADPRIALATASVHVGVHADGWASTTLDVRIQQGAEPVRTLRLACRQHTPGGGRRLRVTVTAPEGPIDALTVDGNGAFELAFDVADRRPGARLIYRIHSADGFVPAEAEPGSADRRELAFRVEACQVN